MDNFAIEPARQGIYPAVCHIGQIYVPLTDEGLAQLRAAATVPPKEFYRILVEVAGASAYLRELIERVWAQGDAAEQTRRLQQAIAQLPAR
ncbi:MAG: hypothetical protein AB1515_06120 [Nitrospirota bacterium]